MRGLLLLLLSFFNPEIESQMSIVYQWKQLDFDFQDNARAKWMQNNTFPLDAEYSIRDRQNRMYVTTPKFLNGVPASLSTVVSGSDRLRPYPSWEAHSDNDCSKIISVLRIKMTSCGELWVLDSGVLDVLNTFTVACPPKLLVFNFNTDREVWRYVIPDKDLRVNVSLLGTVGVSGDCGKEHAYLADIGGQGIVVVNRPRRSSWRVENQFTKVEPDARHFNIAGEEFDLDDGTVSVASSSDMLYFHSLSARKENWVPLNVINNEDNFVSNSNSTAGFQESPGERSGQSGPEALAFGRQVMLFSNVAESALYCWNTNRKHVSKNLHKVYQNTDTFKYASGLKVIQGVYGSEQLLAVTSSFGNIMNGNVDVNAVNYRILRAPVAYLLSRAPICML